MGRKHTPESNAKRAEASRLKWQDPEFRAKASAAMKEGQKRAAADPVKAAKRSATTSAHMKRMHQDPEFQARRNKRSSETLKATWARSEMRARFIDQAREKYAAKIGVSRADSVAASKAANRWILTQANAELRAATDYNAVYKEVQAQMRLDFPYDGPEDDAFYKEYLGKLGRRVVAHPRLVKISREFLSEAIPRWAKVWADMRAAGKTDGEV